MMLNEYMAEFSDLTVILDVGFRLTFYASINRLIPTASAAGDWSSSLNGSWRVAISLSRNWLVTIAGSSDSRIGVLRRRCWQHVVEHSWENVRHFGKGSATVWWPFVSSHVLCAFESSHIWRPEFRLALYWLMHTDHVKMLTETGTAHFELLSTFGKYSV